MSSYCIDLKTNLPLLYLKDNKEALWQKFEVIYSDRIKKHSLWYVWQVVVMYIDKIWADYIVYVINIAMKYLTH
jgi:hypothetical protein